MSSAMMNTILGFILFPLYQSSKKDTFLFAFT
jgi:hypothetical protein